MTTGPDEVIDLTDTSFHLVNHGALANIIIELDDSLNDFNTPARISVSNETHIPVEVPNIIVSENAPPLNRKKSKIKKRGQSLQSGNSSKGEDITDRSPLPNSIGDCPICLERMGTNPLVSTKCGHVFCQLCLEQALRLEKKCPTCRRPMRGNNAFHPLFLGRR